MKRKRIFSRTILQQDGAAGHWGLNVRQFLNSQFPGRWWGRDGPIMWSARSPDLTPLDYFFWGYLRDKVYSSTVNSVAQLKTKIEDAVKQISNSPGLEASILTLSKRCRL